MQVVLELRPRVENGRAEGGRQAEGQLGSLDCPVSAWLKHNIKLSEDRKCHGPKLRPREQRPRFGSGFPALGLSVVFHGDACSYRERAQKLVTL